MTMYLPAHALEAATKRLVESVAPQHSHRKDTRGSLLATSGELPILGVWFPYVGHLDLSLSRPLQCQGASCCQVDFCEVEYFHAAILLVFIVLPAVVSAVSLAFSSSIRLVSLAEGSISLAS